MNGKTLIENQAIPSLIYNVEESLASGNLPHALSMLEDAKTLLAKSEIRSEYTAALICIQIARVKLGLFDNMGAQSLLAAIPEFIRQINPKIDAECHSISGLVFRRHAYTAWKNADLESAEKYANLAISEFERAYAAASDALADRLKFNSLLNLQYTKGLVVKILEQSPNLFIELFVDAVKAECQSRFHTPRSSENNLPGLAIICDLAHGGNIGFEAIKQTCTSLEFQNACSEIFFKGRANSWAKLIIEEVRMTKDNVSDLTIATALILGVKFLLLEDFGNEEAQLGYATNLQLCYLKMKKAENFDMMKKIGYCIDQFPSAVKQRVRSPRYFR
jgi:flagellar biosynthesis regulator FlbT